VDAVDGEDPKDQSAETDVVEPKGGPTQREQDAERALRAAYLGIIMGPLQLYAVWLLLGVCLSQERLGPEYRRKAWKALAISGPFLFLWLLMIKIMLFSDYYYYE
jgi:hypothetical protein